MSLILLRISLFLLMKVIALFIPPWILLQTNYQLPVEVQLLGGIEKVEEEVEIRECRGKGRERGGRKGEEGGEEEGSKVHHQIIESKHKLVTALVIHLLVLQLYFMRLV